MIEVLVYFFVLVLFAGAAWKIILEPWLDMEVEKYKELKAYDDAHFAKNQEGDSESRLWEIQ